MFLCQVFNIQAMIQKLDKKSDWNCKCKMLYWICVPAQLLWFVLNLRHVDCFQLRRVFRTSCHREESTRKRRPTTKKVWNKIKHFKCNTVLTNWFLQNNGDYKTYVYEYLWTVSLQVQYKRDSSPSLYSHLFIWG